MYIQLIDYQENCELKCTGLVGANDVVGVKNYQIKCGLCQNFRRRKQLFFWNAEPLMMEVKKSQQVCLMQQEIMQC